MTLATHQLLPAKLLPPHPRPGALRRARLIHVLQQFIERRLILVCAPAGAGKTTLLRDFTVASAIPTCWYSLDPSDADLASFLRYFVATIQRQVPQCALRTVPLLESTDQPQRRLDAIILSLVEAIDRDGPDLFLVVLDDFQHVDHNPDICRALTLFLEHLPDNCRLVIGSRQTPSLPLARLASQIDVGSLPPRTLRFTAEEVADVLRAGPFAANVDLAEQLATRFDGWIAGILLAAQRAHIEDEIAVGDNLGTDEAVFPYLAEEVYNQLSPELRAFLTGSSVLRYLSASWCDRLLDRMDSAQVLDDLQQREFLLDRLEAPKPRYRYQDLLRSFLLDQLHKESPDRARTLHRRASQLALSDGDVVGALDYLFHGGCPSEAADLLEERAEAIFQTGSWSQLARVFQALPAQWIDARPKLGWLLARIQFRLGNIDAARVRLKQVVTQMRERGDQGGTARVLAHLSEVLRTAGRLPEALEVCQEAVALLPEKDPEAQVIARSHLGITEGMLGNLDAARREFRDALQIADRHDDLPRTGILHRLLGRSYAGLDSPSALVHYERALRIFENLGSNVEAANVLVCLGDEHYNLGLYARASEIFRNALARARAGHFAMMEGYALVGQADVQRELGTVVTAFDWYTQAIAVGIRVGDPSITTRARVGCADTQRFAGDLASAELLLRQAIAEIREGKVPEDLWRAHVSYGALLSEKGNLDEALAHLRDACAGLQKTGPLREYARGQLYLAGAATLRGDRDVARAAFAEFDSFTQQVPNRAVLARDAAQVARVAGPAFLQLSPDIARDSRPQAQRFTVHEEGVLVAHASPSPLEVDVRLLGTPEVRLNGMSLPTTRWRSKKALELFLYLLAHPNGAHREAVLDALWPDADPGAIQVNFYQTVLRARRALAPELIQYDRATLRLNLDGVRLRSDVADFLSTLAEARGFPAASEAALARYQQAISLYRGDFCAGNYSDWCENERRSLATRYQEALTRVAQHYSTRGDFAAALEYWRRAVERAPFVEELQRNLLESLLQLGDVVGAAQHFADYVALLDRELHTRPSRDFETWCHSRLQESRLI